MVNVKEQMMVSGIKHLQRRIKQLEKRGRGAEAMKDKARLKKTQRNLELSKQ